MDCQKRKAPNDIAKYVATLTIFDFQFGDNRVINLSKPREESLKWGQAIEFEGQGGVIWCSRCALTIMHPAYHKWVCIVQSQIGLISDSPAQKRYNKFSRENFQLSARSVKTKMLCVRCQNHRFPMSRSTLLFRWQTKQCHRKDIHTNNLTSSTMLFIIWQDRRIT